MAIAGGSQRWPRVCIEEEEEEKRKKKRKKKKGKEKEMGFVLFSVGLNKGFFLNFSLGFIFCLDMESGFRNKFCGLNPPNLHKANSIFLLAETILGPTIRNNNNPNDLLDSSDFKFCTLAPELLNNFTMVQKTSNFFHLSSYFNCVLIPRLCYN